MGRYKKESTGEGYDAPYGKVIVEGNIQGMKMVVQLMPLEMSFIMDIQRLLVVIMSQHLKKSRMVFGLRPMTIM